MAKRELNKKRLRILARFLGGIDRKHFDLVSWVNVDGGKIDGGRIARTGCGTTACAMGWAANVPSFNRDGLRLKDSTPAWYEPQDGKRYEPAYRRYREIEAAQAFFGLSEQQAHYLFIPDNYAVRQLRSPSAVIARINKLIAGKADAAVSRIGV